MCTIIWFLEFIGLEKKGHTAKPTGLLTGLSLTDSHETGIAKKEPSRFNPFEFFLETSERAAVEDNSFGINPFAHYFATSALGRESGQSVEDLMRDVIIGHLPGLQEARRFTLHEESLYAREAIPGEVEHFGGLSQLEGIAVRLDRVPTIMLLNPSRRDHLAFEEMVSELTTLSWLQDILAEMQLGLDDVIIIDMFPSKRFTRVWLRRTGLGLERTEQGSWAASWR